MRNVDKIKNLEKELGRYRKKVADQEKMVQMLRKNLEAMHAGSTEIQRGVDAILGQTALTYGVSARDEESGDELGYRLEIPMFSVDEVLARYEVRARRDTEKDLYIIGVVPREVQGDTEA